MADDITDVYIATEAGDAGWQSLSALAAEQVDAKLPIESDDGTVVLDSPSANTFTVSTGGEERVAVASGGQLLVGETTLENANFNVHVRGEDSVQICIDSTDEAATTGAVLKLRTGDNKYWNFQHTKNVDGSPEDNQLVISNGSGTFMRGYQDNSASFTGEIRVPKLVGPAFSTDASIALGAGVTVSTGGQTALSVGSYQTVGIGIAAGRSTLLHVNGTPNRDNSTGILSDLNQTVSNANAFGFFQQLTINAAEAVVGNFKAYVAKGLYGAGKVTDYTGYQCETIATGADNVTAFRSRVNVSATGGTNYAFYSEGSAVSHFNGALEVPRIVGSAAPDSDASIQLGAELLTSNHTPTQPNSIAIKQTVDDKIWVGTTAAYNAIATKNPTTLYCLTD